MRQVCSEAESVEALSENSSECEVLAGEQALARLVAGAVFVLSVTRRALGSLDAEVLAAGEGLLGMCRGLGLRVPKAPAGGDGAFVSDLHHLLKAMLYPGQSGAGPGKHVRSPPATSGMYWGCQLLLCEVRRHQEGAR
jgi:hypothetical protein